MTETYNNEFWVKRVDGFEESMLNFLVVLWMLEGEMLVAVSVGLEKLHSQTYFFKEKIIISEVQKQDFEKK